jgi:hypothetical protein
MPKKVPVKAKLGAEKAVALRKRPGGPMPHRGTKRDRTRSDRERNALLDALA